jgi:hypothetical protein
MLVLQKCHTLFFKGLHHCMCRRAFKEFHSSHILSYSCEGDFSSSSLLCILLFYDALILLILTSLCLIHSAYRYLLGLSIGYAKLLVVDMGFVLQVLTGLAVCVMLVVIELLVEKT